MKTCREVPLVDGYFQLAGSARSAPRRHRALVRRGQQQTATAACLTSPYPQVQLPGTLPMKPYCPSQPRPAQHPRASTCDAASSPSSPPSCPAQPHAHSLSLQLQLTASRPTQPPCLNIPLPSSAQPRPHARLHAAPPPAAASRARCAAAATPLLTNCSKRRSQLKRKRWSLDSLQFAPSHHLRSGAARPRGNAAATPHRQ